MVFASPIFLFLFLPVTLAAYFARAARRGATACCWSRASRSTRGARRRTSLLVAGLGRCSTTRSARAIGRAQRPARAQALARARASPATSGARGVQVRELRRRQRQRAARRSSASRRSRSRRSRCRSASRSSRSTRSRTSSTSTSATRSAERNLPRLRALHPALPAADRRADHPLARHRRRSSRAREQRLADFAYGVAPLRARPRQEGADRQHARRGRPTSIFALPAAELTTPLAWLGLACYTLQIYFDFSGYSDMAIGLVRMFGFRFLENFNYPYIARSDPRVLAALAHLAVELVPRLPLHPARRQPRGARARLRATS